MPSSKEKKKCDKKKSPCHTVILKKRKKNGFIKNSSSPCQNYNMTRRIFLIVLVFSLELVILTRFKKKFKANFFSLC